VQANVDLLFRWVRNPICDTPYVYVDLLCQATPNLAAQKWPRAFWNVGPCNGYVDCQVLWLCSLYSSRRGMVFKYI